MSATNRIALYIGNEIYPHSAPSDNANIDPYATVARLQNSPLTSPILSGLNFDSGTNSLVYCDGGKQIFDQTGAYVGSHEWPLIVQTLRSGGQVREVYLSFGTNAVEWLGDLLASNPTAGAQILTSIKMTLGFDGIDLDYEGGDFSSSSPLYTVASAAVSAGLMLTAAPYFNIPGWQAWVTFVQAIPGTVSWLNLQCYAGGAENNPGDWLAVGAPIVPGCCANCGQGQGICRPIDVADLFTLWTTGQGAVSGQCWSGTNTNALAIGGGFIWVYSAVKGPDFFDYMNALAIGLKQGD